MREAENRESERVGGGFYDSMAVEQAACVHFKLPIFISSRNSTSVVGRGNQTGCAAWLVDRHVFVALETGVALEPAPHSTPDPKRHE